MSRVLQKGLITAFLAGLCALLALGSAHAVHADAPLAQCAQAAQPGDTDISLVVGGRTRTAVLYMPPNVPAGQGVPLVIAFHGAEQSAAFFEPYTGFSQIGAVEGFAVLYPNALGGYWTINNRHSYAPDDVAFVSALLDLVESQQCIDPLRIYATGVSNGGGMTARLGCELSSRIAAIAPVAGGYSSLPVCAPTQPVSVLEVHGTDDGVVPYYKGAGAVFPYLDGWVARDRCDRTQTLSRFAPQVLRFAWHGCADGVAVEHLQVIGGAHQLPGGLPPDTGPDATFSAPWAIWQFFSHHRLATA